MWLTLILFIVGFIALIKGADILIEGASSIAKKFNISNLVIGLTIVAFGTSAPELIVSVMAALSGNSDITLGNVIGSNLSNTLLILGVAAIVSPLLIKKTTVNKEIPFSLLAVVAVFILLNDVMMGGAAANMLTRSDGIILILFFIIFMYYTFGISKQDQGLIEGLTDKNDVRVYSSSVASLMILFGLAGLFLGGRLIVDGAVFIASVLGMTEAMIGLTIVAIGTSLPELAATVIAAKKGKADMAVGGIIGSNIFNFLLILGVSSFVSPVFFQSILNTDIFILVGITIVLLILIYVGKKNILDKYEGVSLITLYIIYLAFLIYRG